MSNRIPHEIKVKVVRDWLSGFSRNHIAKTNGMGEGTISAIIKEFSSEIPDLDLLREVAVMLKKNNLSISQFAKAIRLENILSSLSVSEEQVRSFIENIDVHCFKKGIGHEVFIQKVEEISLSLNRYGISIDNLVSSYEQKRKAVADLSQREQQLKNNTDQLYSEFRVTKEDLELYYFERNLDPVLLKKEKEIEYEKKKNSELE